VGRRRHGDIVHVPDPVACAVSLFIISAARTVAASIPGHLRPAYPISTQSDRRHPAGPSEKRHRG